MRSSIRSYIALGFIVLGLLVSACNQKIQTNRTENRAAQPLKTPPSTGSRPKIIAFGDSLTAGFGLPEKDSYPYLLQQKLKADGYDYEVVNAGVSGETTSGGLERIDWVLEQENAKVIILELGANDMFRGLGVTRMKDNLDKMIVKAKAKGLKVLLCGMLAAPTMGADYQRDFTMAFPDLASKHKVEFLPYLLENIALNKDLNQADGIHPNAAGEKIMTDNVYKALKPML